MTTLLVSLVVLVIALLLLAAVLTAKFAGTAPAAPVQWYDASGCPSGQRPSQQFREIETDLKE